MLYMFRWHSKQNKRVTGTSEGHDLQTSPGESCMRIPTKGAAGETSFSAVWKLWTYLSSTMTRERFSNLAVLNSHKKKRDKFVAWENSRGATTCFPAKLRLRNERRNFLLTSDDASLSSWVVLLIGWIKFPMHAARPVRSATQIWHVISMWNFCARFSDVIWRGNQW